MNVDYPDAPRNVSVKYKSTTIICLSVKPPAEDGGVPIYGYRVDYDQGKVLEFEVGKCIGGKLRSFIKKSSSELIAYKSIIAFC